MTYYILLPNDSADSLTEQNVLGEISFKNFWAGSGLKALNNIVNTRPEMVAHITIRNELGKTVSIEEFLDIIKPLKIIVN